MDHKTDPIEAQEALFASAELSDEAFAAAAGGDPEKAVALEAAARTEFHTVMNAMGLNNIPDLEDPR